MAKCVAVCALAMARLVVGHPGALSCGSKEMLMGATMMRETVTAPGKASKVVLTLKPEKYVAGQPVLVTANGWNEGAYIALGVAGVASKTAPNGTWSGFDKTVATTTNCGSQVYHVTNNTSPPPTTFKGTWTAPVDATGEAVFSLLWSEGPGGYVHLLTAGGPPPPPPTPPKPPPPPPPSKSCAVDGTTYKKCQSVDIGSSGSPAPVELYWNVEKEELQMAASLRHAGTGWLSVGFSSTAGCTGAGCMVPASAAVGFFSASNSSVKDYRLKAATSCTGEGCYQKLDMDPGLMELTATSSTQADGMMIMKFTRPLKCKSSTVAAIEAAAKTQLIIAAMDGPGYSYHGIGAKAITVDLVTGAVSAAPSDWKKTVHVYLMIASWGVFAPLGLLVARFGRNDAGKFTPTTMKLHVWCQSFVVLGTAVALVLGLIIGSGTFTAHKILGICVGTAAALQFIVAHLARPAGDAPTRRNWNLFHWWLGRSAVIAAWVNFYFGLQIPRIPMSTGTGEIVAFIGPVLATVTWLCLEARNKGLCPASAPKINIHTQTHALNENLNAGIASDGFAGGFSTAMAGGLQQPTQF